MVFVIANNDREEIRSMTMFLSAYFPGSIIYECVDPMLSAKYVLNQKVDAVWAEAKMHRIDGLTLLGILRENRPDLPVFILSDTNEYRDAAMQQGANDYFIRPFTEKELYQAVKNTLFTEQ